MSLVWEKCDCNKCKEARSNCCVENMRRTEPLTDEEVHSAVMELLAKHKEYREEGFKYNPLQGVEGGCLSGEVYYASK